MATECFQKLCVCHLLWYSLALWDNSLENLKKILSLSRWEAEVLKCVNIFLPVLLSKTPSFCVLFGVFLSLCDFWSVGLYFFY